jgi:phosphatidylglycerophosphatase C
MTVVAAFDLDGTLTVRDCVVPFLTRVAGRPRLIGRTLLGVARSPGAVRSRDRLKAIGAASLASTPVDRAEAIARGFAAEVVADWLRADTLDRLAQHRRAGHRIVIVSASFALYADHIGAALGVDAVLATGLRAVDGVLTGELDGPNCRGRTKVERLDEWITRDGSSRRDVVVHAYGDSAGDRELLDHADVATWVGVSRRRRSSPV